MSESIDTLLSAPHVHRFRDRHGRERAYYRRADMRVPLPTDKGPEAFAAAYNEAAAGDPLAKLPRTAITAARKMKMFSTCLQQLLATTVKRSGTKKRECSISLEWLETQIAKQKFRCALTGVPFDPQRRAGAFRNPFAPSLDRLDNSRGYTPDNVRMILVAVNVAINEWGEEQFGDICHAYVARHRKKAR